MTIRAPRLADTNKCIFFHLESHNYPIIIAEVCRIPYIFVFYADCTIDCTKISRVINFVSHRWQCVWAYAIHTHTHTQRERASHAVCAHVYVAVRHATNARMRARMHTQKLTKIDHKVNRMNGMYRLPLRFRFAHDDEWRNKRNENIIRI